MPKVYLTEAKRLEGHIYDSLARAFALLGITQTEAGQAIGITQSGFSQAFNGHTLGVDQLCELLELTGLTLCIVSK